MPHGPGGDLVGRVADLADGGQRRHSADPEITARPAISTPKLSSLAELHSTAWAGERHICRLAVASCHDMPSPEIGQELADADLERQAARLHVFMDGLTLQTATYPRNFTPQDIRAVVHEELRLLTEVQRPSGHKD
ncbi:TetR family transcriptional regulator C-terminal domain-containing protein [Planomonospora parontospora]|uniref:TetR family transcriptional regulator C-terminal domain-containing protein n=1 Tax=Planomonospora parontospora TaxID=58119 RepID=UPI00166F92BD|nr:TetR family transcriptional regulator C-terminal domain-containing protein [Planomonospora parontospora]GGL49196.1 hypothetical protein GCM10014719_58000 [Planomonospora parontospora subsp. antibiotica]GII18939.1 hypothetical protein Ppa05_56650 [Planomonospora parontospora subsp. antibiotica]